MRKWLVPVVLVVAAVNLWLAWWKPGQQAESAGASANSDPSAATSQPSAAVASAHPTHAEGDAAVARSATADPELSSLHTEQDVARYVDAVEARARQSGELSKEDAAKVARAVSSLREALGPDRSMGLLVRYSARMRALEHELEIAPTLRELAALETSLRQASSPQERAKLVASYNVLSGKLPQLDRIDAQQRLKAAVTRAP